MLAYCPQQRLLVSVKSFVLTRHCVPYAGKEKYISEESLIYPDETIGTFCWRCEENEAMYILYGVEGRKRI